MPEKRPKLTVPQWAFLRSAERGATAVESYPPAVALMEKGLIAVRHSHFGAATFDLTGAGRQVLAEAREREGRDG